MKKETPILFSMPMVTALMQGQKTMTRRTKGLAEVNVNPYKWSLDELFMGTKEPKYLKPNSLYADFLNDTNDCIEEVECPYGKVGDLLWVRETYAPTFDALTQINGYEYKADNNSTNTLWKPSLFMPKVASRIWLEIIEIRIERLHDISDADAIAEGIQSYQCELSGQIRYRDYDPVKQKGYGHPDIDYPSVGEPATSYRTLWAVINGADSWYANPWVWVVCFKKIAKP